MSDLLDNFAADLSPDEADLLPPVQAYAAWAIGRRQAELQLTDHDDVQVRTFLLHRKLAGAGRAQLRLATAALRRFYGWARAAGYIQGDPFADFDFDRPFLTPQETRRRRDPGPSDPQEREIGRLQALNELARRLNEAADIRDTLQATLETLLAVMNLRTAWIFLLPELHDHMAGGGPDSGHDFLLAAYHDLPPALAFDDHRFLCQAPDCSCQGKMRRGELTRAVNIVECTRLQDADAQGGDTRGLLFHASTPLLAGGRPLGIINVATEEWQLFSAAELHLLSTVGAQVATALERASLFDIAESQRLRLERELEMARHVQAGLLPGDEVQIPGFELATFIEPAREVAGDFYDLIALEDGRWGLLIADVSDKGAPAAMYMAMTHSVIRSSAQRCAGPAEALAMANQHLVGHAATNMFVTAFLAVLDPEAGTLIYASAGHDPPLLLRDGRGPEYLAPTGPLLGVLDQVALGERAISLRPGDRLLAYTDGVTDALNPGGQEYGRPRLEQAALNAPPAAAALLQHVLADLSAFCAAAAQHDDITLLALRRPTEP